MDLIFGEPLVKIKIGDIMYTIEIIPKMGLYKKTQEKSHQNKT
jgi:hypothetical protein